MTSERWAHVTKIFDATLDQPQSARNEFVLRECKGDKELEAAVMKLLAADDRAGSFLERAAVTTITGRTVPRQSDFLATGSIICGRFEILRFIGQGGMGQVYEALDRELKERVALKAIRPDIAADPRVLSRFRREVQMTRRITHPNVCRTFDIDHHTPAPGEGIDSGITFLTMELLKGETLADLLRRQGRLTTGEALPLILQMIEALSAAHNAGIVHRDFKPSNVLIVPSDSDLRVVVTDFGLARAVLREGQISAEQPTNSATGSEALIGTLVYMAPEQFERGEATVVSDVYALGLVMYEVVTGQRPFSDPVPFAEAVKRLKQAAPSPKALVPSLDPRWDVAISRCLEVAPERRFQNVLRVAEVIGPIGQDLLASHPQLAPSWTKRPQIMTRANSAGKGLWRKHRPPHNFTKWAAAILTALSLFALIYRYYSPREESRVQPGALVYFADFANRTGETALDNVHELMQASLIQSARINLLDLSRVGGVLQEMTKPPGDGLDQPTAREVAMRTGAVRIVFAVLSKSNGNYRLDVEIQQPDNSPLRYRYHWTESWRWKSEGPMSGGYIAPDLLQNIRDASGWIRRKVGESAYDISRLDTPPEDVTTSSWDALSEYVRARRLNQEGKINDAIKALENAVHIDPKFALAYGDLADVLLTVHREDDGFRAYRKALDPQLERRLSRRERDRIKGMYAIDSWDFETAVEAFKDYQIFYEHDLLGWIYPNYPLRMLGRVDEAVANTRTAIAIGPDKPLLFVHMAILAISQNDLAGARDWIVRARQTGSSEDTESLAGSVAFLDGHYDQAKKMFESLTTSQNPRARSRSYERLGCLLAERGLYRDAIQALTEGMKEDLAQGNPAAQSTKLTARARMKSMLGDFSGFISDLDHAVRLDQSPESLLSVEAVLGPAIQVAPRGVLGEMRRFAVGLEKRLPSGDLGVISQIVELRVKGEAMLAKGNARAAVQMFRELAALDAPMKSREYLGRALVSAAAAESNSSISRRLEAEAKDAYGRVAQKPWFIWVDPLAYPPGALRDELYAYVSLARLTSDRSSEASSAQKAYLLLCGESHDNGTGMKSAIDYLHTE